MPACKRTCHAVSRAFRNSYGVNMLSACLGGEHAQDPGATSYVQHHLALNQVGIL